MEQEVVEAIETARVAATRCLLLETGDTLVLDNFRYLHGRLPYEGSQRLMITVLTADLEGIGQ